MTRLEDDVRERFASIAAPDVPAPPPAVLRKRAHRIRATRLVAAAASVAVVAVGATFGAATLTRSPQKTEYASGVTAIPGHVRGVPPKTKQWQFADMTVAGRHLVAVSFRNGTSICITGDGGGACELAHQIPSTVADVSDSSDGNIRSVVGFVPVSARSVVVHVGTLASTVPAVRTPTSDTRRFFAAFFVKQPADDRFTPVVGVLDPQGQPVPASATEDNIIISSPSHVAGLPSAQWSWDAGDGTGHAVAYRRTDGTPCVTMTNLRPGTRKIAGSPLCAATAPSSARVLLAETMPSGWILMVGDAPRWARGILEWGPNGMSGATLARSPAAADRLFWAVDVAPGAGSRIATCAAGQNCLTVMDLAQVLPKD